MRPSLPAKLSGFLLAASSCGCCAAHCPIEKAHYQYTAPGSKGTAEFIVPPHPIRNFSSAVALHIRFPDKQDKVLAAYEGWFFFNHGNGSPEVSLIESSDPGSPEFHPPGELSAPPPNMTYQTFFAWNEDHRVINEQPVRRSSAPKYLFMPDLATGIALLTKKTVGYGMFRLDHCAP